MQAVPAQSPLISQPAPPPVEVCGGEAMATDDLETGAGPGIMTGQNTVLYSEHGQTNPAAAKAAKRRVRKLKACA